VLDNVGATLPARDTVDARVIQETRTGVATFGGAGYRDHRGADRSLKSGMIDSQTDVGGWPELKSAAAPADADHDGMPDAWEVRMGLNPNDGSDGNRVAADRYTMLEKYLNGIEFEMPVRNIRPARTSETSIEVRWTDAYLAEEGFVVERSVDGGGYTQLAEVGPNVTALTDSSAGGTGRYEYRGMVKASRYVK
jgi:hypothetical protein